MKVYIASSWKNQHAVELLTAKLREYDIQVLSFVENSFGEGYDIECADMGFEAWVKTENAEKAFIYDTRGAMECDAFIYLGPSGKDAAAEVGMCYGQRLAGRTIPMYALYAKGEDFGLMRKVFDAWFSRWQDLVMALADGKIQRS